MMKTVTLFAYLDIERPMVAWETAIGRIQSAGQHSPSGFGVSLWMLSRLHDLSVNGTTPAILGEFRLEALRAARYPDKVSRLQGVYFFESREDALAAIDRWRLPTRCREYISAVEFSATSLTKVDSEWITWNLSASASERWMGEYWSGEVAGVKPLTEVLAIGEGVILDKQLRIEAYRRIYDLWPDSTPLLAAACCAFANGGLPNVALVKPGILHDENVLTGNYFIYMDEFDEHESEVVAAVRECKASGTMPPVLMPEDQGTIFRLPDLAAQTFTVSGASLSAAFAAATHGSPPA